jgi:excisionase family DNA binding protein
LNRNSNEMTARPARSREAKGQERTAQTPMFMTVGEVAELLRTSKKAIYTMTERGQLPGVTKIRKRILIRSDELVDWLNHTCTASPRESRR